MLRESQLDLEREAELRAYAVLEAQQIPALERIADLAAAVCDMAVAEVNVVSLDDVVHVATTNRDHLRVPREHSFCSPVISYGVETYVVPDATQEEPFASSPYVTGEKAAIRSYAAAVLNAPNGILLGNLCVFDFIAKEVTPEQLDALKVLSGLVIDVLESRRSEIELAGALNRLASSNRELHSANESLEAFAGQISHDLQNPLTTIELALEMLGDDITLSPDSRGLLRYAHSGSRRMQRSITDLLDFASAGVPSPAQPVDMGAVVAAVLEDLTGGLVGANIEVSPLPPVLGHESELRSVVQNLIANAVKFSAPHGTAHVQICGEIRDRTARISVIDNGPGIAEADREAVFGLNVRTDRSVPGHGIGLATCARIIAARSGRIGVEPVRSGGSEFWFELPAAV